MPRRAAYPLMLWTFAVTALTFMAPRAPKTCCAEFCPCKGHGKAGLRTGWLSGYLDRDPIACWENVRVSIACWETCMSRPHTITRRTCSSPRKVAWVSSSVPGEQQRASHLARAWAHTLRARVGSRTRTRPHAHTRAHARRAHAITPHTDAHPRAHSTRARAHCWHVLHNTACVLVCLCACRGTSSTGTR